MAYKNGFPGTSFSFSSDSLYFWAVFSFLDLRCHIADLALLIPPAFRVPALAGPDDLNGFDLTYLRLSKKAIKPASYYGGLCVFIVTLFFRKYR